MVSRRRVLLNCARAAAVKVALSRSYGQARPGSPDQGSSAPIQVKLAKEFGNAYLLDVAPDGRRMCLYSTRSLGVRRGDDALQVIELDSWRVIYSAPLRGRVDFASFFPDREGLYAETESFRITGQLVNQQALIDLRLGTLEERLQPINPANARTFIRSATHGALLGYVMEKNPRKITAIVRSTPPNNEEVVRLPFATKPRESFENETDLIVSANRRTLAYSFDHTIVCRRTDDLAAIWTREVEQEYFGVRRVAVSADAGRIAAAVIDTKYLKDQRQYYVGVYEGKDGLPVSRLPVNGDAGIAISPDGQLLAVGRPSGDRQTGEILLMVDIYDIPTVRRVTTFEGYRFPGRTQYRDPSFGDYGIQFTSDSRYLITSSNFTKAWTIGRSQ